MKPRPVIPHRPAFIPPRLVELPLDCVPIARVVGAYGIRGELRVVPYATDAANLHFASCLYLAFAESPDSALPSSGFALTRVATRPSKGQVVLSAKELSDRSLAESFKGAQVYLPRSHFAPTQFDEYYWLDLVGCKVVSEQEIDLGDVVDLMSTGAHDILRVRTPPPDKVRERLIPFVNAYVRSVDIAAKRIVVNWDPRWDED